MFNLRPEGQNICIVTGVEVFRGKDLRKRLNSEKEINVSGRSLPSLKESLPSLKDIVGIFKKTEKKENGKKSGKTYLRAMPLHTISDLKGIKSEVDSGKILIVRITPLADKSTDDVKRVIKELVQFVEAIGGDIARLGGERVVVCPPDVEIWRDEDQVSDKPVPTPT